MQTDKSYDLKYLEEISGGDQDFIKEMLSEFINHTPSVLEQLELYSEHENWDELYKTIHRFIPNFDFIGNNKIKINAQMVENMSKHIQKTEHIKEHISVLRSESTKVINQLKIDFQI